MKNNVFYFSREKRKLNGAADQLQLVSCGTDTRRREINQNASATVSASAEAVRQPENDADKGQQDEQ